MNKSISSLFLPLLTLSLVFSCANSDVYANIGPSGSSIEGIIHFDISENMVMRGNTPNDASFQAYIIDPNQTVAEYKVSLIASSDTIQIGPDYNSFPSTLTIEGADIRTVLGRDLVFGESFDFFAEVVTNNGYRFNAHNFDVTLDAGMDIGPDALQRGKQDLKQAMLFELTLACPEPVKIFRDLVGRWLVTTDNNYPSAQTPNIEDKIVDIIEGPVENQLVIQNLWKDGGEFIVDYNPGNYGLTSAKQEGWSHSHYGPISPQVTEGAVFICAGRMKMTTRHFLADGRSFGRRPQMTLTKL